MTPQQFKKWRKGLALSQAQAALRLGTSLRTIGNYENVLPIPLAVELATEALQHRADRESAGSPQSAAAARGLARLANSATLSAAATVAAVDTLNIGPTGKKPRRKRAPKPGRS